MLMYNTPAHIVNLCNKTTPSPLTDDLIETDLGLLEHYRVLNLKCTKIDVLYPK